jgi:hypothetical protein
MDQPSQNRSHTAHLEGMEIVQIPYLFSIPATKTLESWLYSRDDKSDLFAGPNGTKAREKLGKAVDQGGFNRLEMAQLHTTENPTAPFLMSCRFSLDRSGCADVESPRPIYAADFISAADAHPNITVVQLGWLLSPGFKLRVDSDRPAHSPLEVSILLTLSKSRG